MLPNGISVLAGNLPATPRVEEPFSPQVCNFLEALSKTLRQDKAAKRIPEVMAFSYWCRKNNIQKLKARFNSPEYRQGLGMVFHIAPGNVPINGFYSWAFGILSGNANIVKLTSKEAVSIDIVSEHIANLFAEDDFSGLAQNNALVRFERSHPAMSELSARCDARIIWGGDSAIKNIRQHQLQPRAREITFADRYSFCVIDAKKLADIDDASLSRIAVGFYNDTLQMDQNACSSPHLIAWLNASGKGKERFWRAFATYTEKKGELLPVQAVDRYTRLLSSSTSGPAQKLISSQAQTLYRVEINQLSANLDTLRGQHGLFYECDISQLSDLALIVNNKYQTLTHWGVPIEELQQFMFTKKLSGIDRIVPIGQALDIDVIWDGHDVLKELTRIVDFRT